MASVDPKRRYDGSAAYDLYRTNGSAAPKIEHPGLPEERPYTRPEKRVKVKAAIAPTSVLGMMVAACMLILVIFGYVQMYEATQRVSNLKSELARLQQEQVVLDSLYEGSVDMDLVEEQAMAMGYSMPEKDQVVYLDLTGTDKAEIYEVKNDNIFHRVIKAVESSVAGLVEYLA